MALSSRVLFGQVLNSGFEILNPNGSIKNWGDITLFSLPLDSLGHPMDSVKFDQALYFSTSDAHSGQRALEMRNAYYMVSGNKIPGRASMQAIDSLYGFSPPVPVGLAPTLFRFYYKFLPVHQDTAFAQMVVSDSSGNDLGSADILITQSTAAYTQISAPVVYTLQGQPAFLTIHFNTSYNQYQTHYGTRFLVDDVNTNLTLIDEIKGLSKGLKVFPVPAAEVLCVEVANEEFVQLKILNVHGCLVKEVASQAQYGKCEVPLGDLAPGIYILQVWGKTGYQSVRFSH